VDDRNKDTNTVDVKYRLHIIDSNTYHYMGMEYGYDVIHDDQLEHISDIYNTSTADKDYIGLAFFHIPFGEYGEAKEQWANSTDKDSMSQGEFLDIGGLPYKEDLSYETMKDANILAYFVGHNHKDYGEILYTDKDNDKAILSFGIKSTNQLYHYDDVIGYKVITLKENMTKEQFVSIENIKTNILNVMDRGEDYE
jgi:hypothetical protein